MSATLDRVQACVAKGRVLVSRHGGRELANDDLLVIDVVASLVEALVVEDYPDYWKGPAVLVLQRDGADRPVHVLWGFEKGTEQPAVLITAYRPEPTRWTADFLARRR